MVRILPNLKLPSLLSHSAGALFLACLIAPTTLVAVEFRRAEPTLGDVHAASCRVRVSNARGTGIFNGYNSETGKAYVTTNDHVTSTNRQCFLDFWVNSKMETVAGSVVFKLRNDQSGRDFAVIEVDAEELKKIDPPYIPMKAISPERLAGREIMSSGGPDGRFVQGWRGAIERIEGGMAIFSPPPVPGQSGSGICVIEDGKIYDVAKLTYLLGTKGLDESKGGALPLANLLDSLEGTRSGFSQYDIVQVAEVAEPRILAFTSVNCPACVKAEPGLARAEREDALDVERVDALTEEGARVAKKYGVAEIPTYLAVDATGTELARASFDDISRFGSREATRLIITRASILSSPKTTLPGFEPEEKNASEPAKEDGRTYKLGTENGVVVSAPGEAEKTIAVFITDPASYDFDAERVAASVAPFGLLRDLQRDGNEPREKPTPIVPKKNEEEKGEEPDARAGLGSRAIDALASKLGSKIDAGFDRAIESVEEGVKNAGEEIGARVEKSVVERVGDAWRSYRKRVVFLLFVVAFLATLAARAASSVIKGTVAKARDVARILREAREAVQAAVKEEQK